MKLPKINIATAIRVTTTIGTATFLMLFWFNFGNNKNSARIANKKVHPNSISFNETTFSMGLENENQFEICTLY